jgi:hypothetical protein
MTGRPSESLLTFESRFAGVTRRKSKMLSVTLWITCRGSVSRAALDCCGWLDDVGVELLDAAGGGATGGA